MAEEMDQETEQFLDDEEYPWDFEEGEDISDQVHMIYIAIIFLLSCMLHNSHTYDFVRKILETVPQLASIFKGNMLVALHSAIFIGLSYLIYEIYLEKIINIIYPE